MDLASMLNPTSGSTAANKTPQRAASLAQASDYAEYAEYASLSRTSSLPNHPIQYRHSSQSVSPKTMPGAPPSMLPPAPASTYATPSPIASRKRSLSISDHQLTPQPGVKRRRQAEPPIWARRERDGHFHSQQQLQIKREQQIILTRQQEIKPEQQPQSEASHVVQSEPSPITSQSGQQHWLEVSIDNFQPYHDSVRAVANWLWDRVVKAPDYGPGTHIEVEAKIGTLLDPTSRDQRWPFPVRSEVVIGDIQGPQKPRFESLMGLEQHKRLNTYLNRAVAQSKKPGRHQVIYQHTRETDRFFDIPQHFLSSLHPAVQEVHAKSRRGPSVRLTTDQKTKEVKAIIIKGRVDDLEIFCPNDEFDVRISVSIETHYPHSIDGIPERLEKGASTARQKDRLSYHHQGYQVDLTQVTPEATPANKIHELEVELETERLIEEGAKAQSGNDHLYEKLVETFLNNIKVINRAAKAS